MGNKEARPSRMWFTRSARSAVGVGIALGAMACLTTSERPVSMGRSLEHGGGTFETYPRPPGDGLVALVAVVLNTSPDPLVLRSARVEGGIGLGTVVRAEGIEVAPFVEGRGASAPESLNAVPGGIYETYPPVFRMSSRHGCSKQGLRPVQGFVVQPGDQVLLAVRLRALRKGEFRILRHVVRYEQRDQLFEQDLETGVNGVVDSQARQPPLEPAEEGCIRATGARLY